MPTVLRMPGVSADATEAALVEWNVSPGGKVSRGDVIATVETEKAMVEMEAEEDGILLKTLATPGDSVPIGDPIAVLVKPGEEAAGEEAILADLGLGPQASGPLDGVDEERSQDALVPGATPEIERTADEVVRGDGAGMVRTFASPIARRLAAEAGLTLEDLQGSGPGGRIRRRDVESAIARREGRPLPSPAAASGAAALGAGAPGAAPEDATVPVSAPSAAAAVPPARTEASVGFTDIPHTKFRRAVAAALTASKQQVPHFYLKATCHVDRLLELRALVNADAGADSGVKITINDFLVKAAARAMVEVPDMNVIWTPEAVRRFDSVDVAVAVASQRGLLTPVVRSVQARSLSDISASIKDLAARADAGALKQSELEGGSLAISNLGMFGTEEFAAIINPPQVGILAVGAVTAQPVESDSGEVVFGKAVKVVLSVDHRPVDGALAARWLQKFKELVESPLRLLV